MNAITRAKEKGDNYVKGLPAGSGFWRACKDEAVDIIWQTSKRTGWDDGFLTMIHEALVFGDHGEAYGDILASAYLVKEMAEEEEPLFLIESALERAGGDIGLVMDIFVELIDEDEADLEEAAVELEAICWKKWKETLA